MKTLFYFCAFSIGPVFPTQAVYSASMTETANKTASETIQARARLAKYLSTKKTFLNILE